MVGFSFFGRGSFAGSAVNDYSSQPLPQNGRLGRTRGRPALFRQNLAANNGTFLSREQGVFFGENRGKQVGPVFPRGSCFSKGRSGRVRRKPVHMAAFPREKKTTSLAGPGRVAAFPRRETAAQFFRTSDRGRPKGKEKRRSTKRYPAAFTLVSHRAAEFPTKRFPDLRTYGENLIPVLGYGLSVKKRFGFSS